MTNPSEMPRDLMELFSGPMTDEQWQQFRINHGYPVDDKSAPTDENAEPPLTSEPESLAEQPTAADTPVKSDPSTEPSSQTQTTLLPVTIQVPPSPVASLQSMVIPAPLIPNPLNFTTIDEWFIHLNSLLAVVKIGRSVMILLTEFNYALQRVEVTFCKKLTISELLANQRISDGKRMVSVFDHWFYHANRKTYTALQFAPGIKTPAHVYNLWQGYAYTPNSNRIWNLLKRHILRIIARDNEVVYAYILDWMADLVQLRPHKPGVALVLIGKKRIGKGIFANNFGQLFGRHYIHLISSNQLVGQFNAHFKDTLLAFADEAFWRGDLEAEGRIKGMITEPDLMIEPKGVDAFMIKSSTRFIIASNNSAVVPATEDDTRYLVLHVSDERKGDQAYFDAIQAELDNGGYEAMLYELLNRDLSQVDLRNPPKTQANSDQIYQNDLVLQFLIHCLEMQSLYSLNHIPQPWQEGLVLSRTLQQEFTDFVRRQNKTNRYNENNLGKALRTWLAEQEDQAHPNDCIQHKKTRKDIEQSGNNSQKPCYQFKSITECKAMIEKKLGTTWPWTDDSDADDEDEVGDEISTESINNPTYFME